MLGSLWRKAKHRSKETALSNTSRLTGAAMTMATYMATIGAGIDVQTVFFQVGRLHSKNATLEKNQDDSGRGKSLASGSGLPLFRHIPDRVVKAAWAFERDHCQKDQVRRQAWAHGIREVDAYRAAQG